VGRRHRSWLIVVAALALAVVAGMALWRWAPPSAATDAALRETLVRFELAKASLRPPSLVGRTLTAEDRTALQAAFERRLEATAGGQLLARWRHWDYAKALLADEWDTRELTGCTGRVVYWDFLRRSLDGSVQVRAGIAERYRVIRWDAAEGRATPQQAWATGVAVNRYTLRKVHGVWKVVASDWWRFYDPATHTLGTGP
jgi:hypothetical protein